MNYVNVKRCLFQLLLLCCWSWRTIGGQDVVAARQMSKDHFLLSDECRKPLTAIADFVEQFSELNMTSIAVVYQAPPACIDFASTRPLCLQDVVAALLKRATTRSVIATTLESLNVKNSYDIAALSEKRAIAQADVHLAWSAPANAWAMKTSIEQHDLITVGTRWLFTSAPRYVAQWVDAPTEAPIQLLMLPDDNDAVCATRVTLNGHAELGKGLRGSPLFFAWSGSTPFYDYPSMKYALGTPPEELVFFPTNMKSIAKGLYEHLVTSVLPSTLNYRVGGFSNVTGWGRRVNGSWDGMIGELMARRVRVVFAAVFSSGNLMEDTRILRSPLPKPLDLLVYCTDNLKMISIFDWIPAEECAAVVALTFGVAILLHWSDQIELGHTTSSTTVERQQDSNLPDISTPNPHELSTSERLPPNPTARSMLAATIKLYGATLGHEWLSYKQFRSVAIAIAWYVGIAFFGAHYKAELLPQILVRRSCVRSPTAEGMVRDAIIPIFSNTSGMYDAFRNAKESKEAMRTLADRYNANKRSVQEEKATCKRNSSCTVENYLKGGVFGVVKGRDLANSMRLEQNDCNLKVGIPNVYDAGTAYAVFRLGDPLADLFAAELGRLQQFGLIDGLYRRSTLFFQHYGKTIGRNAWAREKHGYKCENEANRKLNKAIRMKIAQLIFALVAFAVGLTLAGAVFVSEMVRSGERRGMLLRAVQHWPNSSGRGQMKKHVAFISNKHLTGSGQDKGIRSVWE